jgi:hypothetical protein
MEELRLRELSLVEAVGRVLISACAHRPDLTYEVGC